MQDISKTIEEILDFHFDDYKDAHQEIMSAIEKKFKKAPYCHDCSSFVQSVGLHSADHSISYKLKEES